MLYDTKRITDFKLLFHAIMNEFKKQPMNTHADKSQDSKSQSVTSSVSQKQTSSEATFQFADNRPEVIVQRQLQEMANIYTVEHQQPIQKKNNTGLPDYLKSGIENLSGYAMDDVQVHYNSDKPAQLNAHAYAQGTNIHLASGQEKHLPHEAWHVVQQKQGRVQPTMQMKGPSTSLRSPISINDDIELEKEADVMGAEALQLLDNDSNKGISSTSINKVIQRTIGSEKKKEERKKKKKKRKKKSKPLDIKKPRKSLPSPVPKKEVSKILDEETIDSKKPETVPSGTPSSGTSEKVDTSAPDWIIKYLSKHGTTGRNQTLGPRIKAKKKTVLEDHPIDSKYTGDLKSFGKSHLPEGVGKKTTSLNKRRATTTTVFTMAGYKLAKKSMQTGAWTIIKHDKGNIIIQHSSGMILGVHPNSEGIAYPIDCTLNKENDWIE